MPAHVLDAPPRSAKAPPFPLPALPEPPALVLQPPAEAPAAAAPAPDAPAFAEASARPEDARDVQEETLDETLVEALGHPAAAPVERGQRDAASAGPAESGGAELRGGEAASAPAAAGLGGLSTAQAARAAPGACADAGVQHERHSGGGSPRSKAEQPGQAPTACCAASAVAGGQRMDGACAGAPMGVGLASSGCSEGAAAQESAAAGDRGAKSQRAMGDVRRGLEQSELEGMPCDDGVALPGKRPRVAAY